MKKYLTLFFLLIIATASKAELEWQNIGEIQGGVINQILVSGTFNPTPIVVAGYYRSIYLSTDLGSSWTEGSLDAGDLVFIEFYIARDDNNNEVLIGITPDNKLYRKTLDAETWQEINLSSSIPSLEYLFVSTTRAGELYINAFDALYNSIGLYRSADAGLTFDMVLPAGPDISEIHRTFDNSLYVFINDSLYIQSPGSDEWVFLDIVSDPDLFDIIASVPGYVFRYNDEGVYRTSDNGITWDTLTNGLNPDAMSSLALYGLSNGSVIAVVVKYLSDDIYSNDVYTSVFMLSPGDTIWQQTAETNTILRDINELTGNTLIAADDFGILISTDAGANWVYSFEGIFENHILAATIAGDSLLVATATGRIFKSEVFTSDWDLVDFEPRAGRFPFLDMTDAANGNLLVSTRSGIFYSEDNGDTWEQSTINAEPTSIRIENIERTEDNDLFFARSNILFRSTDNGITWDSASTFESSINYITEDKQNGIAVLLQNDTLMRFDNDSQITPVNQVYTDQLEAVFFISPERYMLVKANDEYQIVIYKTTNNGSDWDSTVYQTNLTDDNNDVYGLDADMNGDFYLATISGLYRLPWSGDIGEISLNDEKVTFIKYLGGDTLIAGTSKGLVYMATIAVSVDDEQTASDNNQSLVVPNPVSGIAQIKYLLTEADQVNIEIFNILGEKVKAENLGSLNAGEQVYNIDASMLPTGVYSYVINSGYRKINGKFNINR